MLALISDKIIKVDTWYEGWYSFILEVWSTNVRCCSYISTVGKKVVMNESSEAALTGLWD